MITHIDGKLQEAGSMILADGSTFGVGRRCDSTNFMYNYQRQVHYVSGCFLFTNIDIYNDLGGFDDYFKPAYYEETDLCVRHIKSGGAVIYEPRCKLMHFEFGSNNNKSSSNAISLMQTNRSKFLERHKDWIGDNAAPRKSNIVDWKFSINIIL